MICIMSNYLLSELRSRSSTDNSGIEDDYFFLMSVTYWTKCFKSTTESR